MKKDINIKGFTINCTFDNYNRYKEGSFGLKFVTNLIASDKDVLTFNSLVTMPGSIVFVADGYEDSLDIPEIKTDDINRKTQSQRLRNVLYVYWEQVGKKGEFEKFYKRETEKIIDHYKKKLN